MKYLLALSTVAICSVCHCINPELEMAIMLLDESPQICAEYCSEMVYMPLLPEERLKFHTIRLEAFIRLGYLDTASLEQGFICWYLHQHPELNDLYSIDGPTAPEMPTHPKGSNGPSL